MIHSFGSGAQWELDEGLWELRCNGERVRVQPKVLSLLFVLARNAHRVVSSDELLGELWPDEVVTRSSLARAVSGARTALARFDASFDCIETVARRGYRFRGVLGSASRPSAEPLVGRDGLMRALHDELASASAGSGRIAVLRGDAGTGKTRLLDEVADIARGDGAAVLLAWCAPEAGQPPLWPWARIAADALALSPALARRLGARIAPVRALADPVANTSGEEGSRPASSELHAGAETFRLVDGLVVLLRALAAERPIVLAIDDLQWADRASLRVLELIARDLRVARLLVLTTVRDDELARNGALEACLTALERLAQTQTRRVEPLLQAETAALVRALWGEEPPATVVDSIWRAGLGNPLFTRELVRHVRAGGTESLPTSLRILFQEKLERLSVGAAQLMRVAAAAGPEASLELMRAVLEIDTDALAELVDELRSIGVAAPTPGPGKLRFAHPLVREAVLATSVGAENVRMHQRIAEQLVAIGAHDPDSVASEVAPHQLAIAHAGGDTAPAADWCERAARVALRRCAYDDAAARFSDAVDAVRLSARRDARRELALLLSLGDARARANQLSAGVDAAEAAAALARRLGDPEALARAGLLVFVRGAESGGPYERVLKLLEEAEERSRGARTLARARVAARLSHELFFAPATIARRVALAEEARALVAEGADLETQLFVGYHALLGTWSRLRARERATLTAELTRLADEARDPAARFMVSSPYVASLLECGRLEEVDAEIETLARRVSALEVPSYFEWYPHVYRGMRALLDGRFAAAERLIEDGRELGVRAQTQDAVRNHAGQLAQLRHEQGRDAEAEPGLRAMRVRFNAISVWRAGWVHTLACVGKHDEAREELRSWARSGFPDPLDDSNGVVSLGLLADAAARTEEASIAPELMRRLEPYSGENAAPAFGAVCLGPIDLALGGLALTLGRAEAALPLLEAAERSAERMVARPVLARARLARARALVARGGAGDLARGHELARKAAELAQSLGMPEVARDARLVSER